MQEYKDNEFSKLTLNPYGKSVNADIFKLFPILSKYDVFSLDITGLDRNHVIRYIIYTFDKNTPLNNIDDIIEKRMRACLLAGFAPGERGKFSSYVENMIRSKNVNVNAMVVQYLIMQASADWTVLCAYEESLRLQVEKLVKGDIDSEKTKEIINNVETLRGNIEILRNKLLGTKDDKLLERDLYTFVQVKKLKLSPEDHATMFDPSEEVVDDVTITDLLKEATKTKKK